MAFVVRAPSAMRSVIDTLVQQNECDVCTSVERIEASCYREAQRIAHQPPTRRAAPESAKIATISRAEGGRTACAGWAAACCSHQPKSENELPRSCARVWSHTKGLLKSVAPIGMHEIRQFNQWAMTFV
jgi:hypothetical protein